MFFARVTLLIVSICICFLAGCTTHSTNENKQSAKPDHASIVREVHAKHEAAHKLFDAEMESAGGTVDVRNASKSLLTRIQDIDMSSCPDDYREQCDDYLSELKDVCKTLESHSVNPPASPEEQAAAQQSQQRLLQGIERMNQSGEKVRQIAKKYGVTIGH